MPEPLTIVALVAGLPAGPATEATVRDQLKVEDDLDDASLALAINAVNNVVVDLPIVVDDTLPKLDPEAEDNEWPARIVQGATLLAARVFRRRNSPEGVAAMGLDGALYIQRNDPDVALMLRLGTNAKPTSA